jgi:hypothetical protein
LKEVPLRNIELAVLMCAGELLTFGNTVLRGLASLQLEN